MKLKHIPLLTGLLASIAGSDLSAQTLIIADDYNVTGNGDGFALDSGVNSGINPPVTRLTGTAAPDLRYIQAFGGKSHSAHSVNAQGQLRVNRVSGSSTMALSLESGPFDFSSALNTLAATPEVPAVYEMTIKISNGAAAAQRCSFAISSASGTAGVWDFAIQLYHPEGDAYTLQKRISAGAGTGTAINSSIGTVGTYSDEVSFLIRVTDAGAEADTYNSRVQVSIDNGATWMYDTMSDAELPNGWRFPGASRFVFLDVAGGAGPVTFDDFSLNLISGPTTADRIWTGAGLDSNWSTGANWGGTAPGNGDTLTFDGTTQQANFNDILDLTVPWVAFNNGGFQLSGNPLFISDAITNFAGVNTFSGDVTWDSTSAKFWSVAADSEVVLANNNTVEVNGEHRIQDGGTVRLTGTMSIGVATTANPAFVVNEGRHVVDGGTFTSRGGYRIGSVPTAALAETILTNGANFTLTTSGANLRVGDSANPVPSRLVIDNSTLTMSGGELGIPYASGATGEVIQNGGSVLGAEVHLKENGTYSITGGTLEARQIRKSGAAATSSILFNNAILRPAVDPLTPFFAGVDVAEVQAGGLTLEANTDFVVDQPLSGSGAVTKTGFAKVTLGGSNTYTGNTDVQSGALVVATGQTNASTIQVADGAEFGVVVAEPGTTASLGTVNFNGGSFGTMSFDLASFSTPTAPMAHIASLNASGPVVVNVLNGNLLTVGQVVLVDYDSLSGGVQFSLGSLPPGVTGQLVMNAANSSIDLNITGVPGFRWTGATDGNWDNSTQNWIDMQSSSAAAFSDGFPTEFTDGANTGNINIVTFPSPSALVVSNSTLPYVWSGEYFITTPLLKKDGDGSLTRVGGESDFIDQIELNDGSFVLDHFFDIPSYATVLSDNGSGNGTFVKDGASTLTLAADSSGYNGDIVVQEGLLKMGVTGSLGSTNGGTIIQSGATLDLNNIVAPHEPVTVSGDGYLGQGAIIDSTSPTGVANNLTDVTMVGHTTFGAPNGRWDIRVRGGTGPGPGLKGNGFDLTKIGPGSLSIACQRHFDEAEQPFWDMNLGDVHINEGSVTFAESLNLGNPEKVINVAPNATLATYNLFETNPIVRNVFLTDATIAGNGPETATNVFAGTINGTGHNHLRANNAKLIIDGNIVGSGSIGISVNNEGAVFLNGVNTLAGDTIVTNGTFGGRGSLTGNLVILDGVTSPGMNGVGTFTVGGDATLAGTTLMELDRSQSPNSDQLSVGGSLVYGGTLSVVIASGAPSPQAGDVYQLFNKGGAGSFAVVNLPDLSGLPGGLAWDTANLSVDGSITVTGTATPPTIGTVSVSDGNFNFEGTGGVEGATYIILASPDVAAPVANWIPVATNTFEAGGSFSYSHSIEPEAPTTFFMLQLP